MTTNHSSKSKNGISINGKQFFNHSSCYILDKTHLIVYDNRRNFGGQNLLFGDNKAKIQQDCDKIHILYMNTKSATKSADHLHEHNMKWEYYWTNQCRTLNCRRSLKCWKFHGKVNKDDLNKWYIEDLNEDSLQKLKNNRLKSKLHINFSVDINDIILKCKQSNLKNNNINKINFTSPKINSNTHTNHSYKFMLNKNGTYSTPPKFSSKSVMKTITPLKRSNQNEKKSHEWNVNAKEFKITQNEKIRNKNIVQKFSVIKKPIQTINSNNNYQHIHRKRLALLPETQQHFLDKQRNVSLNNKMLHLQQQQQQVRIQQQLHPHIHPQIVQQQHHTIATIHPQQNLQQQQQQQLQQLQQQQVQQLQYQNQQQYYYQTTPQMTYSSHPQRVFQEIQVTSPISNQIGQISNHYTSYNDTINLHNNQINNHTNNIHNNNNNNNISNNVELYKNTENQSNKLNPPFQTMFAIPQLKEKFITPRDTEYAQFIDDFVPENDYYNTSKNNNNNNNNNNRNNNNNNNNNVDGNYDDYNTRVPNWQCYITDPTLPFYNDYNYYNQMNNFDTILNSRYQNILVEEYKPRKKIIVKSQKKIMD